MNTIKAGQTLTARSLCDYECVFKAHVLERKGSFVTVRAEGRDPKRVKVRADSCGEFIYAMGRHSMAPMFRAIDQTSDKTADFPANWDDCTPAQLEYLRDNGSYGQRLTAARLLKAS